MQTWRDDYVVLFDMTTGRNNILDIVHKGLILSFTESQVKLTIKTEVVAADFKLPDNRWNYVGVVWNGTTGDVSMYINGPEIKRARKILKGEILLTP